MSKSEKPSGAINLSIIAGTLILVNALLLWIVTTWFPWVMPTIPGTSNETVPFGTLVVIGVVCGVFLQFSSVLLYSKSVNNKVLGILIIVFSIPSVIMGGGFIIGFIIGIIGGVRAIKWKGIP